MKKWFLIAVVFLLALAGCSSNTTSNKEESQSATKQEREGSSVIKIGWKNDGFPSPFTFGSQGPGGFLRNSLLFDSLTWKDDKGVTPWLAKEWSVSEDGLQYTFLLEEDVQFHDGQPFTADDVVFTYEYFKKHPFPWNADMTKVKSVEKKGEHQVVISLEQPFAPFITDIAGILPIIPKHIWEKVDQPLDFKEQDSLVGTGPFTLAQYDEKSGNYQFKRNEQFFKGNVIIDELQYLNVENRLLSLQNNEINAGMTFNYHDVEEMKKSDFDVIKSEPTGSAVRILFNLDHPQLKDKKLRQALAYALNREEMAKKLTGNNKVLVGNGGIIPPDSPWFNKDVQTYDYSLQTAEKMLDELGYKKNSKGIRDGLDLSIIVSSTSQEAELMKEMLKDVGIDLQVKQVDPAAFTTAIGENKYDMTITGHIGLSGDPDFLRLWFMGAASNSYAGRGKVFDNNEFQRLANLQLTQLNEEERKQTVNEMQKILAEELPTLVLYHRPFYFIHKQEDFDSWFNTYGGIADGIPLWENKAAFIE